VIGLISRASGATIADLSEATGWLPHTVRANLTGLRKRGISVESTKPEGGVRSYRIVSGAPDMPSASSTATGTLAPTRSNNRKRGASSR